MERLDPLLLGDIPEDLPMDLFDEDFMDSYCNELACTATEAPNGIHAGGSVAGVAPVDAGLRASEPFSVLLDTATDWLPDDLQAPDTSLSLSAPASRVVTTGAFPVTSQGPANFQTGLSVQQQRSGYQPAQQPVSSQHADMLQQPGIRHSAMQPQGHMPSYMQPTAAQPQSNAQAPDEILSTVEEALERAGNVPPDVKAQLMEYMAATTRQQAATARGQAARANPCSLDSQPSWMPEQFVSGPTATDHIPSNSSLLNGYVQPNLSNERNLPAGTAWDMNSDLQHAPFGMQQPQAVQGSSAPSARFSAAQPSLQMPHPPAISTHMGQSFQGMPTDPQISQKQPPYQALLQSGSLPRSGPALAARSAHDMLLQRDSLQSVQHQAQAQSLQNQAQTINHRQQPVTAAQANGFAPSRTSQQMPQSASVAATADAQASGSASLFDAWNLPHLASPQQLPMTSGSPVGSANMHSDPFSAGIGSQAQMHSALMAPLLDPRRSLSPQTSQGLGPVQASLPAALPALTREQLFAARQAQQVHHSQPAQHAQPAQRAQQAVPRAGLHNQGQVPLGHPQAAPVRAGPPDQPARIPQGVHALPQELLPAMYQSNSQQSSDASCGFGGPAYSSQFLPSAAQVGAAVPQDAPPRTSLDIPLSAGFPDFQGSPAENPVDWENIINLDGEADQQQTQQDGNLQQDQTGQGQDNGKAGAAGKPGEKQRRKRKRDAKQQELNKQAQHRYRERKKAKHQELAAQVSELSTKAADLKYAQEKRAELKVKNEKLLAALAAKKAEIDHAKVTRQQQQMPAGQAREEKALAEKVTAIEQKAHGLAQQLHNKVFELDRHLKQSGLANKENVPWDGGAANPAAAPALQVIRRLVREIQVIAYEAHKLEGADVWEVVHRRVPLRPCTANCNCLHCKDQDAWLDVAESLKLTDEQKSKTMLSRDHTLQTLDGVYAARTELNLEAVRLMIPQGVLPGQGAALKQEFAEMSFFKRAHNTGKMGEVVDKLKANLRQEAYANAVLDYIMFDRVLSSVQSAWLITEAYPLKFDCRALATAVYQLWGHMQLAPGPVPQQQAAARLQQPIASVSANTRPQHVASHAMLQPTQQQQQNPSRGVAMGSAEMLGAQQAGNLRQHLQASQQQQPQQQHQQQQPGMQRVPASLNLSEAQQRLGSTGLTQVALAHQQRQQQQRQLQQQQLQQQQQQQQQQRAVQPQLAAGPQALQNALLRQTMSGQRNLPTSAGLLQGQGIDKWQWQQMLQQQMGMPVHQQGPVMPQLTALQQATARQPTAGLLDQRLRGLGALQGSSAMLAGAIPRPAGAHLPMAVP